MAALRAVATSAAWTITVVGVAADSFDQLAASHGESGALVLAEAAGAVAFGAVLVWRQSHQPWPLLPEAH